jgi:hypothetical protein
MSMLIMSHMVESQNGFSELLMNCSVWAAGLDCYQTNCDPASAMLAE